MSRLGNFVILTLAAAGVTAGAQSLVQNAQDSTRAASTLAQAVAAVAPGDEPAWAGWRIPMVEGDRDLCASWLDTNGVTRVIGLEGRPDPVGPADSPTAAGPIQLEAGAELVVLVRVINGRVERLRTVSGDCPIDSGDRRLEWLTNITPAESVRYLTALARDTSAGPPESQRISTSAIGAIALHRDAAADAALTAWAQATTPRPLRDTAASWLGRARGTAGYETLSSRLDDAASDDAWRRVLVSGLAESADPRAAGALLHLARTDKDAGVRASALAGYAARATSDISVVLTLVEGDAAADVRTRGIQGLLRRGSADAVPALVALARRSADLPLRKAIVGALGGSSDPRALAYLTELIRN